jgi:LAO/AO transport system kinase
VKHTIKPRLAVNDYAEGISKGNRVILGQAITLIESNLHNDQLLASQLIEAILPNTGKSIRIGITGVPGVGKSTFIEAFGKHVIDNNKRIAVLTIDPSSQLTKGSILGDKTRMEDLSKNPNAFIRPSSSGTMLGGVAMKTREAMLLCEAAGFDVILIETVGVGQSEISVKKMTDFFLLLMLAGAGDELQGIKKGIMEMADGIVITKADGDNLKHAMAAQSEYQHALHLQPVSSSGWSAQVLTSSAHLVTGIGDVWKMIQTYTTQTKQSGYFKFNRENQNVSWFHDYFEMLLKTDIKKFIESQDVTVFEKMAADQQSSPQHLAQQLLLD